MTNLMMSNYFATSLPPHGVPTLIPEITSAEASSMDGKSVRVVGRVDHYNASECIALLSEPNKSPSSGCPKLRVNTHLTEASDYIVGSQVMLIGELEVVEVCEAKENGEVREHLVLKARVSRCVDRVDYMLYCKSVEVWRKCDSAENNLEIGT